MAWKFKGIFLSPMRTVFLLLAGYSALVQCFDIEEGGMLDSDYTMTTSFGRPYLIRDDLFVGKDAVLRIQAGVEVRFSPAVMLAVNGTLIAEGTPESPVTLTKDPSFGMTPPSWPEDIRLVDEWSVAFGRLQLLHKGKWRGVCANSVNWTQTDVDVACQQLGFKNGTFSYLSWSRNDTDFMLFHKPDCTGSEKHLMDCPGSSNVQIGHKICVQQKTVHLHCEGLAEDNPAKDNWWGLEFYNASYTLNSEWNAKINESASILQNVIVEFAGVDKVGQPVPAIRASPTMPSLVSVSVQHCALDGTNFTQLSSSAIVHNSKVKNNRGHGLVIETKLGHVFVTDSTLVGNYGNGIKAKFLDGRYPILDESKTFCRLVSFVGPQTFPQLISGIPYLVSPCEKKFQTQAGHRITLNFLEMDIEPDSWAELVVYDDNFANTRRVLQIIEIQNGTMPAGITSTYEHLYVEFRWTKGMGCPTLFDCVKFTILLDSSLNSVPEFSMNNTDVSNNTQHGLYLENARNYIYVNASTMSNNMYGAGLRVYGGAGDVHVNASELHYNRDNAVNITYDGGLRIFNMSSFNNNYGNAINVTFNETRVDNQTRYTRQQVTEVFRCTFIGNDGYGVRVGNYCRAHGEESPTGEIIKNKVAVNDSEFEFNKEDGVNLESCFMIIPETNRTNFTVSYNRFYGNHGHGIRITPLINAVAYFTNNTFEAHPRHAFLLDNTDDFLKTQYYSQMYVSCVIMGNTFVRNKGFYVAHVRLTQGSSRQSCEFKFNDISENDIKGPVDNLLNERTRAYSVVILSSSNIVFLRNRLVNPNSKYELATHLLDKSVLINCIEQYWGTIDYNFIIERIFDQFTRYNLAQIKYHPVLRNDDMYNSPVTDELQDMEIRFDRGTYLGGRLGGPFTTQPGKTYIVDRDINVLPPGRFQISPGTVLEFGNALGILIQGDLQARGNDDNPIIMHLQNATTLMNNTLVRLVEGSNDMEGRLEVRPSMEDQWGTVCNKEWDWVDASVVCQSLGLVIHPDDWLVYENIPGSEDQPIWRSSLRCTDLDMDIMECRADGPTDHSCTHQQDVYVRCKPPTWAGLRFLVTARPGVLAHAHLREAGLMDPTALLYSPAIAIDYNTHTLDHLLVEDNVADGVQIMKNDVFSNVRISNSIVRNNLGNGVSSRTSFFEVYKCELSSNTKAGFEYNPHYTAYEAQQMRAGISTQYHINSDMTINLVNEGREFVVTDLSFHMDTYYVEISVSSQYRVVMDIIDYNPDNSQENVTVFDGRRSQIEDHTMRWKIEKDLVDFPVESRGTHLTVRWTVGGLSSGRFAFVVRSKPFNWPWPFGTLRVTNSTTENNKQGIVTRHYNQPSNEFYDLFFRYRWETLTMFGVTFQENKEEALHVPSLTKYHELYLPTYEELQIPEKIAEINYEIESCLFRENGAGVQGEHNHVEFSNNVWIWEVFNNRFERNKGGGFMIELPTVNLMYTELYNHSVEVNDTIFQENTDFAFRVDGFYCNSTIARNQWLSNECKVGCITIAGTEKDFEMHDNKIYNNVGKYILEFNIQSHTPYTQWVEARMEFNDLKNNRRLDDGLPRTPSSSPTSYTFGVKGLQNITINRNLFKNEMDFELLGGHSSNTLENYLDVTENYWGTTDQVLIQQKIFDFDDWNSFAIAEYYPYLLRDELTSPISTTGKFVPEFDPNQPLGGRIESNMVLPTRSEPYIVRSDLTVMPGVSLLIHRGVELQFYPNVGILVLGSLTAAGRPESRIKFNPVPKSETDGISKRSTAGDPNDPAVSGIETRLIGGETENDGWLEVYNTTERRWVLVCDDSFNDRTAEVACKTMGREWSNVFVTTHRYYDIFVLGYPKMHEQVIEWFWRRTFICDGSETNLDQCRYKQNYNLHQCMEQRAYSYVRCGPRNLAPEYDYWGNIRFSTPKYEHGDIAVGFSDLEYVDVYGAGILHDEKVAAIQSIHRVPSTSNVRVSHCNWNGYDYIAPRDEFTVMRNTIENNNGYAIGGLVLNGDSRYDIPQSSFDPLVKSAIPYNVYGLVRMCTTEKLIYVKDRLLLYYKYRFDTIDCIKIIRSQEPRRQVALRFLQVNMFHDNFFKNVVEMYSGEYFSPEQLLGAITSKSSTHDKSIMYKTSEYSDTMGIRVTASPAYQDYGFIAEVVTLPLSPTWRPELGAGIRQQVIDSHLVNNQRGGFMFMNVGELNPSLIIEQNHITDCGLALLNMTGPPIMDLFVQNSKMMTIANNYIAHNAGSVMINSTTKGQATRIYSNITNNVITYNTHGEALHVEGHRYQEFEINHNYIAFNHLEHRNVLAMFGVALAFTSNIVFNNSARCILNASVPEQVTINQRFILNHIYDNWAFAENRSTIFLRSAKFSFNNNYLINRLNIYEMVTFNRTKHPDGTYPAVDATNNWWGGDVESFVAGRIWDRRDDDNLIEVYHTPFHKTNASVLSGKCNPGWRSYDTKCYWYFGGVVDYTSAEKLCRVQQGRLANARDRHWERGYSDLVSQFQENYDEHWVTWVYSHQDKGSLCTALKNAKITHVDCNTLLPFLCEKDMFIQPTLFMRDIWISIGVVAGGMLIVLILLCFHCFKSNQRQYERMERKNSMRRVVHSSKASLHSIGRTTTGTSQRGYDDVQQQKRRRPPIDDSAFLNLSGVTLDASSSDVTDKMRYHMDSHRPSTPASTLAAVSKPDTCSYFDSDLGPVHGSREMLPGRLENEITNYSARQPSYEHVFRNNAYDDDYGGSRLRMPSSSTVGYPPEHRYSGGADIGGASFTSYPASSSYHPSGYAPSVSDYEPSSRSYSQYPSTRGYLTGSREFDDAGSQAPVRSERSYMTDTSQVRGGERSAGSTKPYVKPPRPKPKEFDM